MDVIALVRCLVPNVLRERPQDRPKWAVAAIPTFDGRAFAATSGTTTIGDTKLSRHLRHRRSIAGLAYRNSVTVRQVWLESLSAHDDSLARRFVCG